MTFRLPLAGLVQLNGHSSTGAASHHAVLLTRRSMVMALPLGLAACATVPPESVTSPLSPVPFTSLEAYAALPNERFPLPAADLSDTSSEFLRTIVPSPFRERAGTVVVDTNNRFLYLMRGDGTAVRYGVGVGREGIALRGRAVIGRRAEWPNWTPTANMIRRDPEKNGPWAGGMPAGLDNPLGARALYLYRGNTDTMFRIHGTNEPWSIGQAVSSGCVRMINHDVIDLYNRVGPGTSVLVL